MKTTTAKPVTITNVAETTTVCEVCNAEMAPGDSFCTSCGATRTQAAVSTESVSFSQLMREPFDVETQAFWRRALWCALITLPGFIAYVSTVLYGLGSITLFAISVACASVSVGYVLFIMKRPVSETSGPRFVVTAAAYTGIRYIPVVLLGELTLNLVYPILGRMYSLPILAACFPLLLITVTACEAGFQPANGINHQPGKAAPHRRNWHRNWHRYASVALFTSVAVAVGVPVCLLVAALSPMLPRGASSQRSGWLQPLYDIAAKLPLQSPRETAGPRLVATIKALPVSLLIKFPATVLAYWYMLLTVAATLTARAWRGDVIVFANDRNDDADGRVPESSIIETLSLTDTDADAKIQGVPL